MHDVTFFERSGIRLGLLEGIELGLKHSYRAGKVSNLEQLYQIFQSQTTDTRL